MASFLEEKMIFLYFLFCTLQRIGAFQCKTNPVSVVIIEFDSVILKCDGSTLRGRRWYANDTLLYTNQYAIHTIPVGVKLLENKHYALSIAKVSVHHEGIYCCHRNMTTVVTYNVTTQVFPDLSLYYNNYKLENPTNSFDLLSKRNRQLELKCTAVNSRPAAKLTWFINKVEVEHFMVHNLMERGNEDKLNTFDSESTLRFTPYLNQVNISCVYISLKPISINLTLNIEYTGPHDTALYTMGEATVVVLVIVIVLILLVLIGVGYWRYLKIQESRGVLTLRNSTVSRRSTLFGQRGSFTGAIQRIHLGDTKRRSIANHKKRSPKDVTLIAKLAGDGIITTWTAKAVSTPSNDPQFVARTVTDSAQMTDLYNFQSCAAYLSSLEKNTNLVNFFGAAVDNVPYYIYQEHVQCGSMRDYLMMTYRQERSSRCDIFADDQRIFRTRDRRSLLISFAKRVANGMAFLESKKFRHPGLSARKVLLTPAGNCKLYDFWPRRLTSHRVKQILCKKPKPVAWLAPEILFLDEYVDRSDSWSYGVLLWEIFSLGETPHVGKTCDEIEAFLRANDNLSQPLSCPEGWYGLMLSAWDRRPRNRPSFQQIKEDIVSIAGHADGNGENLTVEDETGNYIEVRPF
ncbi:uncharacterized protein [Apostichopus japonicus]|uniref:uncharacterized protein isoform X2 n=1 Tax=Stichopus japonicus TaxID=307972 RepID=UPI003AB1EFAB